MKLGDHPGPSNPGPSNMGFIRVTDCIAFQKTVHKRNLSPKIARLALFLDEHWSLTYDI